MLVIALVFFASCAPQQKMSKVTGGYTDVGVRQAERTISKTFVSTPKRPKTRRHPSKYYEKNRNFFARAGINGQLPLYKY